MTRCRFQSQNHFVSKAIIIIFLFACFIPHIVLTSAAGETSASPSVVDAASPPSPSNLLQSDCDKSMLHIANVLFGFTSGEAALKVIREAITMCPSKIAHRFTLIDHLLTPSSSEQLNSAYHELQAVMRMIVDSAAAANVDGNTDTTQQTKDLNAVLTRWTRLDKVRAEFTAKTQTKPMQPTAEGSTAQVDAASTIPTTDESTQRDTNAFMSELLKELQAGSSNDLFNVEQLPANLRLLWPLPFQQFQAQRLMPFNSHLIALAEKLKQQIDAETPAQTKSSSALKKGYSLIDTTISPATAHAEPSTPCSSQNALYSQFCDAFVAEVTRALRSPLTIGDQRASSGSTVADIHVELLRKPSLQLDETLDAHRPAHEGVWSDGTSAFPSSDTTSSKLAACENEDGTDCWSPPFLFTALYVISRPNDGLHPLAKDLTIDDELSFADPRVQAGMLSFATSTSETNPISGSFLAQGEPLRYSLGEGLLFLFPSWVSRSLAPNTSGRPRIFSTLPMVVRFKYSQPTATTTSNSQQQHHPQVQRPHPNIFFRWATPVYRSLLHQQSMAPHSPNEASSPVASDTTLQFTPESFAKFNEQLRQGLLSQRAYQLAQKNWKIKSNRGGWHSSIDLLSTTPTLSPATDSSSLQQALSRLKRMILAHVAAYLRDVGEAACHPFIFHPSHDTCRAFPWRKLFQTNSVAKKAAAAAAPAGLGFLFGGGGGAAPQLDYHHLDEFIEITQSWSVINLPGHYNMMHTHPDSIISGVYYVSLGRNGNAQGSNQGTNVHFRNPLGPMRSLYSSNIRLPQQWIEPFATSAAEAAKADLNDAHNDVFEVVQEGKLLMFPAWLEHYVIPHRSEQEASMMVRSSASSEGKCSEDASAALPDSECSATKAGAQSGKAVEEDSASIDDIARICIAFNVHFK